jgi:hypothetical protein
MKLWGKESNAAETGGEFEQAAARVTVAAESPADAIAAGVETGDRLEVRPEWAQAAARLCFLPAARLSHPAYALTDEEAEKISPQIQALLQAVADKYAPALVGRVANKHPELFDAAAAPAPSSIDLPGVSLPLRPLTPKAGERDADGVRVI